MLFDHIATLIHGTNSDAIWDACYAIRKGKPESILHAAIQLRDADAHIKYVAEYDSEDPRGDLMRAFHSLHRAAGFLTEYTGLLNPVADRLWDYAMLDADAPRPQLTYCRRIVSAVYSAIGIDADESVGGFYGPAPTFAVN